MFVDGSSVIFAIFVEVDQVTISAILFSILTMGFREETVKVFYAGT